MNSITKQKTEYKRALRSCPHLQNCPDTHFNSCDESGRHSLFKFDYWGVQRQHFYNLQEEQTMIKALATCSVYRVRRQNIY